MDQRVSRRVTSRIVPVFLFMAVSGATMLAYGPGTNQQPITVRPVAERTTAEDVVITDEAAAPAPAPVPAAAPIFPRPAVQLAAAPPSPSPATPAERSDPVTITAAAASPVASASPKPSPTASPSPISSPASSAVPSVTPTPTSSPTQSSAPTPTPAASPQTAPAVAAVAFVPPVPVVIPPAPVKAAAAPPTAANRALNWAQQIMSSPDPTWSAQLLAPWSGYCEAFVEIAYGTRFHYGSALAHYRAQLAAGRIRTTGVPPAGAIVFYGGEPYGHVAISSGDGRVVTTWGVAGQRYSVRQVGLRAFSNPYLGWAEAPSNWPGR
jgi:hypothetical protein